MRADAERVVVTGLGCVSGFGLGREAFWSGISAGRCAIRETRRAFKDQEIVCPAAAVPAYAPADHFPTEAQLLMDPFAQYAVLAAREAVADAGLPPRFADSDSVALVLGTATAGELTREEASIRIYHDQRPRGFPMTVPKINAQAAAGSVSADLGVTGPAFTVATGCAAATHAVGVALLLLRQGVADCVIAGGSEAGVVFGTLKVFDWLRVLARDTCRPFSRERGGMVMGEGAGVVVLETLARAARRGARIYGEVLGMGMSADAADLVHPTVDGPAKAMRAALADAGLAPEQVGYVNAHGTGTPVNDRVETAAIRRVFGDHAGRLAVSSTKSMIGHALGAGGGLELAATLLALHHRLLPPTANYLGADPDCDLDYVVEGARSSEVEVAISNSFGFGGLNAVLAVGRFG